MDSTPHQPIKENDMSFDTHGQSLLVTLIDNLIEDQNKDQAAHPAAEGDTPALETTDKVVNQMFFDTLS